MQGYTRDGYKHFYKLQPCNHLIQSSKYRAITFLSASAGCHGSMARRSEMRSCVLILFMSHPASAQCLLDSRTLNRHPPICSGRLTEWIKIISRRMVLCYLLNHKIVKKRMPQISVPTEHFAIQQAPVEQNNSVNPKWQ
jgi:hypothetical protein